MPLTVNGIDEIIALEGRDLGRSSWREVTQDHINTFAEVSGDHQWIHTDPERAARGAFGRTVAHGFMTLSWGIPILAELLEVRGVGMALNYGTNRVRFPAPVLVDSRVRLHAMVSGVERVGKGGVQVTRNLTFEIDDGDKPACVAEYLTRYYP